MFLHWVLVFLRVVIGKAPLWISVGVEVLECATVVPSSVVVDAGNSFGSHYMRMKVSVRALL